MNLMLKGLYMNGRKANLGCSKRVSLTGRPWFYRSKTSYTHPALKQQPLLNVVSISLRATITFNISVIIVYDSTLN